MAAMRIYHTSERDALKCAHDYRQRLWQARTMPNACNTYKWVVEVW